MPAAIRIGDPVSCGDNSAQGSGTVFVNGLPFTRRDTDNTAGHCYVPITVPNASPNVLVNGIDGADYHGAVRIGDAITEHCCPNVGCHGGNYVAGSSNVFVNSSESPGIIDNNPTYAALSNNDDFIAANEDINFQSIALLPGLTPADRYLTENFDTVEDKQENPAASVPPGTTVSGKVNTVEESDEAILPPETPPSQDCSVVDTLPNNFSWATYEETPGAGPKWNSFSAFAYDFALSPNFTVASMTVEPVYKHKFSSSVQQPTGLTQKQILLNMCHHAKTVLEPMHAVYPGEWIITSGWRSKSGGSQHNKGQATDFQFPAKNGSGARSKYYELAQAIRDTMTYDQLILEWGNNPWIHMSSNPGSHRKSVLTQRASGSSSFVQGLHLVG